ncbi:MAG: hypothetical protein AAFY03_03030 [Pseudomonadota bacterium]
MPLMTEIRFDALDGRVHGTLRRNGAAIPFSVPGHRLWTADQMLDALIDAARAKRGR